MQHKTLPKWKLHRVTINVFYVNSHMSWLGECLFPKRFSLQWFIIPELCLQGIASRFLLLLFWSLFPQINSPCVKGKLPAPPIHVLHLFTVTVIKNGELETFVQNKIQNRRFTCPAAGPWSQPDLGWIGPYKCQHNISILIAFLLHSTSINRFNLHGMCFRFAI